MLSWLKRQLGFSKSKSRGRVYTIGSKFDAISRDPENRNHWLNVDSLSPTAAVNYSVRKDIRERARYEVANNSVAFGVATTRTHDLIGSGPRLQLSIPEPQTAELVGITSVDRVAELEQKRQQREELARKVEDEFCKWAVASGFAELLRVMKRAEFVDGESFAAVTSNPKINHPCKLQLKPFECDRVTDTQWLPDTSSSDGIKFDAYGNPVSYRVLRQHPGDEALISKTEADTVDAANIFHFYREDRPGQTRGVSWLMPCLNLFAILRRYSLAVLGNAETAANIAVLIEQTDGGQVPEDDGSVGTGPMQPYVEFDGPRRGMMGLPPNATAKQLRSEHATTAYGDFRREILNEIGRCLDMPLNVIQGNSSRYNYSSGRLDFLPYQRKLWIERDELGIKHLNRVFLIWCDEATVVGLIPDGLPPVDQWQVEWNWDGFDVSGDPTKETAAIKQRLDMRLTTLAIECAASGLRWQDVLRQLKKEQDYADSIGLRIASTQPSAPPPTPAPSDSEDRDVKEEDREGVPADE